MDINNPVNCDLGEVTGIKLFHQIVGPSHFQTRNILFETTLDTQQQVWMRGNLLFSEDVYSHSPPLIDGTFAWKSLWRISPSPEDCGAFTASALHWSSSELLRSVSPCSPMFVSTCCYSVNLKSWLLFLWTLHTAVGCLLLRIKIYYLWTKTQNQ